MAGGGAKLKFKNSKITSTLSSMESVEKVFSAAWSEGQGVRRKTHFARKTGSKVKFLYKGRSAVVVSSDSPLIFILTYRASKSVTFYMQRYMADDFVIDLTSENQLFNMYFLYF